MIKSNTNNQHITWSKALKTIISEDGSMKLKEFLDKYKISYPKEINCTEDSIVSLESQMLIDTTLINNCYQPIFAKTVSYSTLNNYLMFMKMHFQENQLKIFEDKFKEVFDKWFNVQKDYSSNVFGVDNVFGLFLDFIPQSSLFSSELCHCYYRSGRKLLNSHFNLSFYAYI